MASCWSAFPSVVLFMAMTMVAAASAATYALGGSSNWTVPTVPTFYATWASSKTFQLKDKLIFNFKTGEHNVMKVSKKEYDACTAVSPLESYANGPVTLTLNSTGLQYYLCSVGPHCSLGQKVAIDVAAAATKPSTPPTSSLSSPPPSAFLSPSPSSALLSPPSSSPPFPDQPKSAASIARGLGLTIFLCLAVFLAF